TSSEVDARLLPQPRTPSSARHREVSGGHPVPLARGPSRKPCAGNPHARFPRGSYGNSSTRRGKVDLPMDAEQFRKLGHALVDWTADYRETGAARPVRSPAQPGEIKARMPSTPPEHGGAAGELIARLDADVLPGITHWSHPGFFAYFPSVTSYASILGDLA